MSNSLAQMRKKKMRGEISPKHYFYSSMKSLDSMNTSYLSNGHYWLSFCSPDKKTFRGVCIVKAESIKSACLGASSKKCVALGSVTVGWPITQETIEAEEWMVNHLYTPEEITANLDAEPVHIRCNCRDCKKWKDVKPELRQRMVP